MAIRPSSNSENLEFLKGGFPIPIENIEEIEDFVQNRWGMDIQQFKSTAMFEKNKAELNKHFSEIF